MNGRIFANYKVNKRLKLKIQGTPITEGEKQKEEEEKRENLIFNAGYRMLRAGTLG